MNFSASALIKQSAKQIFYFRTNNPKGKKSERLAQGIKFQKQQTSSQYIEMRGCYEIGTIKIFYCFDEIRETKKAFELIEYKLNNTPSEPWYLQNCLLQVALYESLLTLGNKWLNTAKFLKTEQNKLKIDKPYFSLLQFGKKVRYSIKVTNPQKIIRYYHFKASSTLRYETAKLWDNDNKHQDWKNLNDCFTYKKL